jgi:hypothetical protein
MHSWSSSYQHFLLSALINDRGGYRGVWSNHHSSHVIDRSSTVGLMAPSFSVCDAPGVSAKDAFLFRVWCSWCFCKSVAVALVASSSLALIGVVIDWSHLVNGWQHIVSDYSFFNGCREVYSLYSAICMSMNNLVSGGGASPSAVPCCNKGGVQRNRSLLF